MGTFLNAVLSFILIASAVYLFLVKPMERMRAPAEPPTKTCPACGSEEAVYRSISQVRAAEARCPKCQDANRQVQTFFKASGSEVFLDRTLNELGLPPFDIITARTEGASIGIELSGDARQVLGPLWEEPS